MRLRKLDAACVLFLVWAGIVHYGMPLAHVSMSWDSFNITALMDEGKLPWFTLREPKEPGRPFVALPWWLARELLGGSVAGYNLFMAACLCLTPLVLYLLVRMATPDDVHWAFLAASLKVVWPGDLQAWYNFLLHVHFVELLYCFGTFILVALYRGILGSRPAVRFGLLACLVAAVSLVVGSYQIAWPLVLLTPLTLLATTRRARAGATSALVCWYVAAAAWMLFSLYLSLGFLGRRAPGATSFLGNLGSGLRAVFWDVNVQPVVHAVQGASAPGWRTLALAGTFGLLVSWTGRTATFPCPGPTCRRVLALVAVGVVAAAATLLPPSFLYPPLYGTRLVRWASYGCLLSLLAAYGSLPGRRWRLAACLTLTILFGFWSVEVTRAGAGVAAVGSQQNRFWEALVRLAPRLEEGTIVVIDGRPPGLDVGDEMCTAILRQFTNTWQTFLLVEGVPSREGEDAVVSRTALDLEPTSRAWLRDLEQKTGRPKMRLPRRQGEPRTVRLPLDRIVLLRWHASGDTLEWVAGRPLRTGTWNPTGLGAELFPGASR